MYGSGEAKLTLLLLHPFGYFTVLGRGLNVRYLSIPTLRIL
jgi:hypothetical protein